MQKIEEVPVQQAMAKDLEAIGTALQQMTHESIPAFYIRDAAYRLEGAAHHYTGVFDMLGYSMDLDQQSTEVNEVESLRTVSFAGRSAIHGDIGLHTDMRPGGPLVLGAHLTVMGGAKASFFEQADDYLDTRHYGRFKTDIQLQIDKGSVDEAVLKPVRYTAALSAGTLVIFRLGGTNPLAHDFVTTSAPRRSTATTLQYSAANDLTAFA